MSNTNPTPPRPPARRLAWLAVAAITAMLAVASSSGAAANASETAEAVDLAVASYAADYSVTHQEAQRRLDRIQPLQDILAPIRELETARLAGWGIDHTGTFTGWVWLTGNEEPGAAAATIADAHTDVQIRTGATHSRAALLAAQTGLFQDVGPTGHTTGGPDALAEVKRVVTYTDINMRANAVEIGIDPALASTVPGGLTDPGPTAVTDETLQTKITEVTALLQDHINVTYTVEDGRGISSEESFAGGEDVRVKKGKKYFACTSGFAAQENGNGRYGIITAGHCGDKGPNESASISMHSIVLPYINGWASVNADAQFHRIPTGSYHELRDDYQCEIYRRLAWCDVTGDVTRSDMIDDYVCHTGRNSGITCGTVTSISYQPDYTGACWSSGNDVTSCNHVFVEVSGASLKSCKGDSGGPWYRSGTAYGIHKGSNSPTNCNKTNVVAHFSAIDEVKDLLGVQILTDGNVTVG